MHTHVNAQIQHDTFSNKFYRNDESTICVFQVATKAQNAR